ncbi:N-acetylmuramoyl-L-alanine amidase [Christensenella timonensis]|uniref:peptidoglycan recognition protein family protein n=1 Tax=Christensenella timonensis TaxID=1816678 RepID=UPI00082AC20C|nr:N-acetylmuramoyl-L-alanine amidase [Christensenella timonensis]
MFEYIKDYKLQFSGALTPRRTTKRILLHHTSGGDAETVAGIHAYHLSKGHKGIDYNICVERDGSVAWGRGLTYCGGSVNNSAAGTRCMNDDSVAIAALGDFEHNSMPDIQKEALKRVARDVARYYGLVEVKGHNEVAGRGYTDCPGRYFPLDEVRSYAAGSREEEKTQAAEPGVNVPELKRNLRLASPLMRGGDVQAAQGRLAYHKAQPGSIDGIYGEKTRAAAIRFQKARIAEGYDLGTDGADGVVGPKTWAILWQG